VATNSLDRIAVDYNVWLACSSESTRHRLGLLMNSRLVEILSRTLSTLLSMNGESMCVLCSHKRPIFGTVWQLDNWILSAKLTQIWIKRAYVCYF